jgi:inhibitor of cysteine peptidase
MTITEADNGKTIRVSSESVFRIALRENPTTGYRWVSPEFDPSIVSLESNQFSITPSGQIGEAGLRNLNFAAKNIGRTRIRLQNVREWEQKMPVKRIFEITIEVE